MSIAECDLLLCTYDVSYKKRKTLQHNQIPTSVTSEKWKGKKLSQIPYQWNSNNEINIAMGWHRRERKRILIQCYCTPVSY
jgi:hypothetical protein